MSPLPAAIDRRALIAGMAFAGTARADDGVSVNTVGPRRAGWLDAREDFKAQGDGAADDTRALQAAIDAGSSASKPVRIPPGAYRITRPLTLPPNSMLAGAAPGLGFGCRIESVGCPAFVIGGKQESFHCSIEDLMIWPKQAAPDHVISIDNSYSVRFKNIRIHDVPARVTRAAVLLLGEAAAGGHGPCHNVIWDNLIVRNDGDQPGIALLAAKGCGTHRFFAPDLENYNTLVEWQGGGIDFIAPYTERAGRYGINCNLEAGDEAAYFNTVGGLIGAAASGVACAIRSTTRRFNSYGTSWGSEGVGGYAYSVPAHPVNFYGVIPNLGPAGTARFAGVSGWRRMVRFPDFALTGSRSLTLEIPPRGRVTADIEVPGVAVDANWARAAVNADARGTQLSAYVSATDRVTLVAHNPLDRAVSVSGVFVVECGSI